MSERLRSTATLELPKDPGTSLRCSACSERACRALGDIEGVLRVECDAAHSRVTIEYDNERVTEHELSGQLENLDLALEQTLVHAAWRISGLD